MTPTPTPTPLTETAERVAKYEATLRAHGSGLDALYAAYDYVTWQEAEAAFCADVRSLLAHVAAAEKALREIADSDYVNRQAVILKDIARAYFEERHAD